MFETKANAEDPDQIHFMASDQGLHYLLIDKNSGV